MSVHLEVTQAAAHRAVNGQRRSAASSSGQQRPAALWLRLRRGQRLEATSISGPWGLFLSLWCDFKTFKYEWTANSRTWRVIIARSFRKNGFWQKISEQIDVYAAVPFLSLKESGIDTWHTFSPHVQWALPDRNVAQPLVRCFLSVVLPHSAQIPHRRPTFIGFPFKRNRPFRGQIWFATPHVEKDRPALWT